MGEIKRHLRDDGPIKVSRIYKKLSMEIGRARNKILTDEGREPTIVELAEICQITVEDAAIALETINPISSLSETFGEDEKLTLESQLASNDCEIEKMNDKIALGQAISKLPPDWQKIITLRYYRNMTQQQVADALGLSQVKISREEKKILSHLREELIG
jgi:RNA polymerase sporulation-specific sigma factor